MEKIILTLIVILCLRCDVEEPKEEKPTKGACEVHYLDKYFGNEDYCKENLSESGCDYYDHTQEEWEDYWNGDGQETSYSNLSLGESCIDIGYPLNCGNKYKTSCEG